MDYFYRLLNFAAGFLFLSLIAGCGGGEEAEVVEIPDNPPQVTITLRSEIILDQPLDPDPQSDKSVLLGENKDRVANRVEGKPEKKKRLIFGRKAPPLPAFKADEGYQSINRFERFDAKKFEITMEKKPAPLKKQFRETVKVQDRALIFAGRGFNIEAFENEIKPAVEVDYASHLRDPVPPPLPAEIKDHLDPEGEYSKDTKELIYSATRAAFGKMPPPLVEAKPIEQNTQRLVSAEKNPDSVLLFPAGEESLLVLEKNEKQLDLLAGNESLNKKRFRSDEIKDPETSKRISKNPK